MTYKCAIVSEKEVLLINDDNEKLVLELNKYNARVLYTENNPGLLHAAEKLAKSKGCTDICGYFSGNLKGLMGFYRNAGYDIESYENIISVDINELFSSKATSKSMNLVFEGAKWIPLDELLLFHAQNLFDLCRESGIFITKKDMERFDADFSGVTLDSAGRIQAFVLVSTSGHNVIVECLHGISKDKPKYVMAALQGMAHELMAYNDNSMYRSILAIEKNKSITPLLKRLLDKECRLDILGKVSKASKAIDKKEKYDDINIEETGKQLSTNAQNKLDILLRAIPCQNNINWKVLWDIK